MYEGRVAAIVLRSESIQLFAATKEKYYFFTPTDFSFQAGVQNRPKGDVVPAHFHRPLAAFDSLPVQEFLYILSGGAEITLFAQEAKEAVPVLAKVQLGAGDCVILNTGHSIVFTEDTQCLNLKQGPYRGRDEEKIFVDN